MSCAKIEFLKCHPRLNALVAGAGVVKDRSGVLQFYSQTFKDRYGAFQRVREILKLLYRGTCGNYYRN
jgi:hypothetical protein